MATRNTTRAQTAGHTCTEFVLHKSQQQQFNNIQRKIIDYTEHRLIRYAKTIKDPQQQLVIMALIVDYRKGDVAIAWKSGLPVYIRVQKDSMATPKKSSC